jgi:RimJ/RimL family protein N-acetyltransferase
MQATTADLVVVPVTRFDRGRLADLFARMSRTSRYGRFQVPKAWLTDEELRYFTDIDHRTHDALAAVDPRDGSWVGTARYVTSAGACTCADVAFEVADAWHGRGVGTMLLQGLTARAQANGLRCLAAMTLIENTPARALLKRSGFHAVASSHGVVELRRALVDPAALAA